ncbi:MAG: ORF6N domain-containing protein [Bacteroidales bacterium]|nr:ORF6N domain-containing protein [Bacteroidales bacterium]
MTESNNVMLPDEVVMSKIYVIRGIKVMLDMDLAELKSLRSQFATSNRGGVRYLPMAFTEQEMLLTNKDILHKLRDFEMSLTDHDDKIRLIFEYLKQLEKTSLEEKEFRERKPIGFR